MNRTNIDWADWSWNPITGCRSTSAECAVVSVCYARRTAKRLAGRFGYPPRPFQFQPTFHPRRLEEPYKLKKPARIFVCSMGELFGPWVPKEWQEDVLSVAGENPRHTFQILTKYPECIPFDLFPLPPNVWLGVTVNTRLDKGRIAWLNQIKYRHRFLGHELTTFVSAEPLLDAIHTAPWHDVDWLIIGAQTKPNRQPRRGWIEALLNEADHFGLPVFMKSNLHYYPQRREFPGGVTSSEIFGNLL